MYIVLFLIVFSVFIRRFLPSKGFLLDDDIENLTYFGEARKIELRNLKGYSTEDLVSIAQNPVKLNIPSAQPAVKNTETVKADDGIDLADIKGKSYDEVDTSYMYGNIDAGNESLSDTLRRGGL